jgi:hypothetical protein
MYNLLIKKEYRDKHMFTDFLYNDLWGHCEQYIEQIVEPNGNTSTVTKAVLAAYNLVSYCGKTAIDDNKKIDIENFIKNQFSKVPAISCTSILVQLFDAAENFLVDIKGQALLNNFKIMKERTMSRMDIKEEPVEIGAQGE